jgi:hypothetical protein
MLHIFSLGIAVTGILFGLCGAATAADLRQLEPEHSFSVAEIPGLERTRVREFRSSNGVYWFLLQNPGREGYRLVSTDMSGRLLANIGLPGGGDARSLAVTDGVVATLFFNFQKKRTVLLQYDFKGTLLSEEAVLCGSDGLLVLSGRPAVVCVDGNILVYGDGGQTSRYSSWIRSGSLAESLSSGALAIIDQETAQIVLNEYRTGTLTAMAKVTRAKARAAAVLSTTDPPLGRHVIIVDTAADPSGFYLLLWPYHGATGPSVVHVDNDGLLKARYHCRTGGEDLGPLHKIDVQGGYLILAATNGRVLRYALTTTTA